MAKPALDLTRLSADEKFDLIDALWQSFTSDDFALTPGNLLMWRVLTEPAHFIMERRMLLGLRERAERTAAGRSPRPGGP